MITRQVAISNLKKYIGHKLSDYVDIFGITINKDGKYNKGRKGQALEYLAGLTTDNRQAPNGLGFELKSVSYIYNNKDKAYNPKETMAITMINPKKGLEEDFFKSHCWDKLKSVVFCAVSWESTQDLDSKFLAVTSFDFLESDILIQEIKQDYDFIRNKLITQGFESLTGKDGKWIQARTKGAGHGSISRAFYARKNLLRELIKISL